MKKGEEYKYVVMEIRFDESDQYDYNPAYVAFPFDEDYLRKLLAYMGRTRLFAEEFGHLNRVVMNMVGLVYDHFPGKKLEAQTGDADRVLSVLGARLAEFDPKAGHKHHATLTMDVRPNSIYMEVHSLITMETGIVTQIHDTDLYALLEELKEHQEEGEKLTIPDVRRRMMSVMEDAIIDGLPAADVYDELMTLLGLDPEEQRA